MKKSIIFLVITLAFNNSYGQITFEKTYGSENTDAGKSVTNTFDGGYIIAATYNSQEHKVIKTDNLGDTVWTKTYPFLDSIAGQFRTVIQTRDSNYVLLLTNAIVLKINDVGNTLWWDKYETEPIFYSKIAEDHEGNLIVVGSNEDSSDPNFCCSPKMRKLDSKGNMLSGFSPSIPCPGPFGCRLSEIFIDNEGNYLVSGDAPSFEAVPVPGLTKIDTAGNTIWSNYYPITFATIDGITQESDSSYLLVGINWNFNDSTQLFKTDKDGNLLWWKKYKGNENGWYGRFIDNTSDGYFIAGSNEDIYLMKIDLNYNLLWSNTFGGSSYESISQMKTTNDGGCVMIGATESFGSGSQDIYFIKTNQDGLVVGLNEFESNNSQLLVFPNPFSIKATIKTERILKNASLIVLNSTGQIVKTLKGISGQTIDIYRNNAPAGIYFYILKQNNITISTGRFLIIQD